MYKNLFDYNFLFLIFKVNPESLTNFKIKLITKTFEYITKIIIPKKLSTRLADHRQTN